MKKNYSIGRDGSCDIVIYDASNVVSRKHAVLRVDGKRFYLTDLSTNGTYRNGIRLTPYVEYPVCPKDEISFGSVTVFDWSVLPELQKKSTPVWLYVFLPIAILLLAGCIYYYWPRNQAQKQSDDASAQIDSLADASSADSVRKDSLVVLKNVLSPRKSTSTTVKKTKRGTNSNSSKKSLDNYKDSDDEILQDAL